MSKSIREAVGLQLFEDEIVVSAVAVKYHDLKHFDRCVVITQNRTKRRVPDGYHFEDTGVYIYLSYFYSGVFSCKSKERKFIVNTKTKEWRPYPKVECITSMHTPEIVSPVESNEIESLKR